jgi:hypothetical protein
LQRYYGRCRRWVNLSNPQVQYDYASHYFWTALEIRVLVSDPSRGTGFWFVTVNSSRCDGMSGFFGRLIRGRIRREVQTGVLAYLSATKKKLEQQAR